MRSSPQQSRHLTRRDVFRVLFGALVTTASLPYGGRRPSTVVEAADLARDNCYWTTVGPEFCVGGRRYRTRCEICCAGGTCETVQCLNVDLGPC